MSNLIAFNDLTIALANKPVLNIAELNIPKQQCTLLTGRNGSGKTTLLKIISGLLQPDTIQVSYQGLELTWAQAKPLIQRDVIYMHQQPYLFDSTVMNNIAYGLKRRGDGKHKVRQQVLEALDWAQLSHLAHRNALQLSGGEKQRVALSRARVLSPRLLLLDEPTASMDIDAKEQTTELLKRLKDEGVTLVVSSHEAHVIHHLADIHWLLEAGKITTVDHYPAYSNITTLNPHKNISKKI